MTAFAHAMAVMVIAAAIGLVWTSVASVWTEREIAYHQARERCAGASNTDCQNLTVALRGAIADERAADLAAQQLWLSLIGAIGLGATVLFAAFAWREARRSANVAHREYIATHRPRLRVRYLQDDGIGGTDALHVWVILTNVGETNATITEIGGDIGVRSREGRKAWDRPGINASAAGRGKGLAGKVLATGEVYTVGLSGPPLTAGQLVSITNLEKDLLAAGEIRYRDDNGVIRHTAFLWRWDPEEREFYPLDEPRWNYED